MPKSQDAQVPCIKWCSTLNVISPPHPRVLNSQVSSPRIQPTNLDPRLTESADEIPGDMEGRPHTATRNEDDISQGNKIEGVWAPMSRELPTSLGPTQTWKSCVPHPQPLQSSSILTHTPTVL